MLGKHHGKSRVHTLLHRAGYGAGGAQKIAEGGEQELHHDIAKHLSKVEQEVDGKTGKARLDRKGRQKPRSGPSEHINLAKTLKSFHKK